MIDQFTFGTFMIALVAIETAVIIMVWWGRSPWWKYQAGRSIMALLFAQLFILSLALISRVVGYEFPFRDSLYIATYLVLAVVMGWVGVTILLAQAGDRRSARDGLPKEKEK